MHGEFGYSEEKELGRPYDVKLLKRMYPFTRPYRGLLIISILLVSLMALLDLSVPYVTKIAVDRYIVPKIDSGDTESLATGETKIRLYPTPELNPSFVSIKRILKHTGPLP